MNKDVRCHTAAAFCVKLLNTQSHHHHQTGTELDLSYIQTQLHTGMLNVSKRVKLNQHEAQNETDQRDKTTLTQISQNVT